MSDTASQVDAMIRDYLDAFNSHDFDRVASYWAEDAVSISPFGDEFRGRAALREFYKQSFQSVQPRISDYRYDCRIVQDHVIIWESWKVTVNPPGEEPKMIPGNGMWAGQREADGVWRTFWCMARLGALVD